MNLFLNLCDDHILHEESLRQEQYSYGHDRRQHKCKEHFNGNCRDEIPQGTEQTGYSFSVAQKISVVLQPDELRCFMSQHMKVGQGKYQRCQDRECLQYDEANDPWRKE